MNLRRQTLVVMGGTLILIGVSAAALTLLVFRPAFLALEEQQAALQLEIASGTVKDRVEDLARSAADWAAWDDAWSFVTGADPGFPGREVTPAIFETLDLELLAFADGSGRCLAAWAPGEDGLACVRMPPIDPARGGTSGLLLLDGRACAVAVEPVTRSSGQGGGAGYLVMVRCLEDESGFLDLPGDIGWSARIERGAAGDGAVSRSGGDLLTASMMLGPAAGDSLALRLTLPRTFFRSASGILHRILLLLAVSGLVYSGVTLATIHVLVVRRLRRLMTRLRSAQVAGPVPEGPVDADEVDRVKLAVEPVLEHLETMAAELRESERRNAVLLGMMPDTILIVSNDGTIRSVQPGRGSCSPLQDGVAGGNLADLEIRAEADVPSMLDRMDDGSRVQSFTILCGSGGNAATLDARMVRLDPESILVVARDVTQKERAGETATRLQRLESLGLLAGGIAHDFNNRLAAALGSVELAMAKGSPEWGDAVQDLDRAVRAIEGAAELSRRLLTFSSGGDPVMAPVSLPSLAASVLEPIFRGTAVLFSADLPGDLWDVEGDEEQLALMLRNIAVNSLEALGGHGSFTISAANATDPQMPRPAKGRFVSIILADNGSGFSDEALGKAFEPYFSTRADSRGLGLSVCHSIAVKHGGWIDILPGPGARVQVILPAAPGETPGEDGLAPSTAIGGTGRILVMDDDPLVLETVSEMLEALDYSVETSRDGGEAFALFSEAEREGRPYDLLILDLVVPGGIGGLETLTRIRQRFGDVAAIVSSGYSSDSVLAEHAAHGFRAALRKPFRFDELGSVVARVIAGERSARG